MTFALSSPAFSDQEKIPRTYTCEDKNISPPLEWSDVPDNTKSLALIVDDPDAPDPKAPQRTWVHWLVYNMPPDSHGLPAAASSGSLPEGSQQGMNDYKHVNYGGPCPPIGKHRYFFKLYALDTVIPTQGELTKNQLESAMQGHVIARAELVGTLQR